MLLQRGLNVYKPPYHSLILNLRNLEKLKKMLVLLSEERKVVLSHHKTFEHVEKMRSIVNESIEMANKS